MSPLTLSNCGLSFFPRISFHFSPIVSSSELSTHLLSLTPLFTSLGQLEVSSSVHVSSPLALSTPLLLSHLLLHQSLPNCTNLCLSLLHTSLSSRHLSSLHPFSSLLISIRVSTSLQCIYSLSPLVSTRSFSLSPLVSTGIM